MKWLAALALLVACTDAVTGENVELENPGGSIKIDIAGCHDQRISAYLPFGSMWIEVAPESRYVCTLTLGGETEDPNYSGGASQRCSFVRFGSVTIEIPTGGPPHLDHAGCVDL